MSVVEPLRERAPRASQQALSEEVADPLLSTFRRVAPVMWRQALAVLGDRATAEDAVQEAFLRVWRRRDRLPPGADLEGYLVRAARNLALDLQRWRARREPGPPSGAEGALVVPRHEESLAEAERLSRALARIPAEQREVVLLHVIDGLTFPEVAARTEAPLGTVHSRFRYALTRLRQILESRP